MELTKEKIEAMIGVVKRLIWFLLREDISFNKQPVGGGITIFYIDKTMTYFTSPKKGGGNGGKS